MLFFGAAFRAASTITRVSARASRGGSRRGPTGRSSNSPVRQKIDVDPDDMRRLRAKLRSLPQTARAEAREAAQAIADDEARRIAAAGMNDSPQAMRAAGFVRARKDQIPTIAAGGNRKTSASGGATAGQLFFGAEFGGRARSTTQQFRPHKGREGYWFWPQLREDQDRMFRRWEQALDAIAREWNGY